MRGRRYRIEYFIEYFRVVGVPGDALRRAPVPPGAIDRSLAQGKEPCIEPEPPRAFYRKHSAINRSLVSARIGLPAEALPFASLAHAFSPRLCSEENSLGCALDPIKDRLSLLQRLCDKLIPVSYGGV
jgi:hypothetical protein